MHYFLVTTFKHETYFPAMLDSLRAQYGTLADFHRSARILVVDDASPDNTPQVLLDTAHRHPNVEVFLNATNRGIGFNRNFLLNWFASRSPGPEDFVAFVDGDDLLPPGSLQAKLDAFATEPALQCVGGQMDLFFGENTQRKHRVDTFPVDPAIQAIANLFECHFYVSNAMFRATVFLDAAVRFPEAPCSEDWLFFTLYPLRKRHIPEVTLLYRRHDHNLTIQPQAGTSVADLRLQLRRQARALALLRVAMFPTQRDCELLDLVSYLSFRMQWYGATYQARPHVRMPWFGLLSERPEAAANWACLSQELAALFGRIVEHNDRVPAYDGVKLRAYFAALLEMASTELQGAASAPVAA